MRKRLVLSGLFMVTAILFLSVRVYDALAAPVESGDSPYENIQVLTRALQLIRDDYVDDKKTSYHDLAYAAIKGLMSSLDPHSQFMEPEDFRAMQDDTRSKFGGLGVTVTTKESILTILSTMEKTPGARAGLLPGDQIWKIDGVATEKFDLTEAVKRLRGDVGEKVTLTIMRPATRDVKDYELTREEINVPSVTDAKILGPEFSPNYKVGYLRITQFNEPTAPDLAAKLDQLEKDGMQALIMDLRYNPGGLLKSAVDVCGQFLPSGTTVVSTEGRKPSQRRTYATSETKQRAHYPIAILINARSASGSEIVAGALKDLGRAILVGETTFGKGSVQSVIQLPDGSALRLTTARYYTPSKQVIHEKGVSPDLRATLTAEEERLLMMQRREEVRTEAEQNELTAFRDPQLDRAVDALKGLMIYADRGGEVAKSVEIKRASAVN